MYSAWIIEYAHAPYQPVGSLLSGRYNAGTRELAFSFVLLKGEGHIVLIDLGTNGRDEETVRMHTRDGITNWQPPQKTLARVGVHPEEVDTVFITHAHYDHIDNWAAFPNAQFIMQEDELMGWELILAQGNSRSNLCYAVKTDNIREARKLATEGRMKLVRGKVQGVLPGIDLLPAYNGHTFASQYVVLHQQGQEYAFIGDIAYVRENISGENGDRAYIPVGLATGSATSQFATYDEILNVVKGDLDRVIIVHDPRNWTIYPSREYEDGLHIAEICAHGDDSIFH